MLKLDEQIKLGAELIKIPYEFAKSHYRTIENSNAICVYSPNKGGGAIIVGDDGQVMLCDSAYGFDEAVKQYNNGARTPLDCFNENDSDDEF